MGSACCVSGKRRIHYECLLPVKRNLCISASQGDVSITITKSFFGALLRVQHSLCLRWRAHQFCLVITNGFRYQPVPRGPLLIHMNHGCSGLNFTPSSPCCSNGARHSIRLHTRLSQSTDL